MFLIRKLRAPDAETKSANETPKDEVTKPEKSPTNLELAKALNDLKENSVSKEDYEKLQKENKDLIDQVINGGGASDNGQGTPTEEVDIEQLREELYGPKGQQLSNLEVIEKTLKLRDAVIAKDGIDPFLPIGANIKPTDYDAERAQAVADVLAECVAEANGDSGVFTAILQSRLANDSIAFTNRLKKLGIKFK